MRGIRSVKAAQDRIICEITEFTQPKQHKSEQQNTEVPR